MQESIVSIKKNNPFALKSVSENYAKRFMLGKWVASWATEGSGETHLPFSIAETNWGITVEVHRLKETSSVLAKWHWKDQYLGGFLLLIFWLGSIPWMLPFLNTQNFLDKTLFAYAKPRAGYVCDSEVQEQERLMTASWKLINAFLSLYFFFFCNCNRN